MNQLPSELSQLIQSLSQLPNVGSRTATRYAMNMLQWSPEKRAQLAQKILALANLTECQDCGVYMSQGAKLCSLCSDPARQAARTLCVVENFQDYLAIEKGQSFKGQYHLLSGVLNPLMGVGPDQLRIGVLLDRVKAQSFTDVILALNPSLEGDATCSYLAELLAPHVRVTRIGFGIPIGAHLEYLDEQTILSALENRKVLSNTNETSTRIQ